MWIRARSPRDGWEGCVLEHELAPRGSWLSRTAHLLWLLIGCG